MSEDHIKINVHGSGCKRYTIPRKQRLLSEDCQQGIPLDSREAREIINTVHHSTWESTEEFDRNFVISKIYKVENQVLEREFQTKRTELRDEGRSAKELSEHYAFKAEYFATLVKEQCTKGLYCNEGNSTLGDGKMGVNVWKCPDLCLKSLKWPDSWTVFLMVFRIMKGKVKPVTPKQPNSLDLEPTPNFDSHVAKNVHHSSTTDIATLMIKTQYYLYEYNDEGLARDRPRHCLPFAVIHVNKVSTAQPEIKQPEPVTVHIVADDVHDTPAQLQQHLSESDGKMAWRGLIGHKESSLGVIAIMAGHKLGLTLWKSFIEVSKKISLDSLLKVIPGDIRTAWTKPLHYRGHTFSLCMLKPCGPSDKFISFIRSLSTRDHAAGVVTVDSSTVLFLVPSSKFSVELGFCEEEEPWRMFCIVRRRPRGGSLPDTDAQRSCLNMQAFPPNAIEPQGLNINLRIEVPNLATGIQELKVMNTRHVPVGPFISRSKSLDCTKPIPISTILRRVSDTGYNCSKNTTQEQTNTKIFTDDGGRQQQQKTLLSTLAPPPPPTQMLKQHPNQPSISFQPRKQQQILPLSQPSESLPSTPRSPLLSTPPLPQQYQQSVLSQPSESQPPIPGPVMPPQQLQKLQSQPSTSTPQKQETLMPKQQQPQPLFSTPLVPRPPLLPTPGKQTPQVKHPDEGTKTNQQNPDFNTDSAKVSLFTFDNIPFLEHTSSPHQVVEETHRVDKREEVHMTDGNHGDKSSGFDVTLDALSSLNQAISTQRDVHHDDIYRRHLQTLVPCTNSNTRHQVSQDTTDTVCTPLTLQLPNHRMASSGEHGLSPRSFDVYTKHKQTLKRKSISTENGKENPKKIILDDRNESHVQKIAPEQDSCEDVSDSDDTWTSGLQVIELMLVEQEFQEIDEKVECLEKENAFEILNADAVIEIAECQATTAKELPGNDVGVSTKEADEFADQLAQENTVCKDGSVTVHESVCGTQPSVQVHKHHPKNTMSTHNHSTLSCKGHTSTIPSKDHTSTVSSTIPSKDHTSTVSSTIPSKDHTSTTLKKDHTSTISSKDHTSTVSSTMSSKDHTSTVSSTTLKKDHTSTISNEDHTSTILSKDHTSTVSSTTLNTDNTSTIPSKDKTSTVSNTISSKDHTSTIPSKDKTSTVSNTISSKDHTSTVSSTISSKDHTSTVSSTISSKDHTSTVSRKFLTCGTPPFLDEKENKTLDSSGSEMKAQVSSKPVSGTHPTSIPYCYSGSSRLLFQPPPLKARRLVNDSPFTSPRYHPGPPPRINIMPNHRFNRLPFPPCNTPWRTPPFLRPPLFFPNGFPRRPPFVPRPRVAQYICYGDKRNRIL